MPTSARNCLTCVVRGPNSFCSLSNEALIALQSIGVSMNFPARSAIFNEGFAADSVYVICHGRIKLTASSAEGRLLVLRVAVPGDVLGLASILRSVRHHITAETLERCEIKAIPRTAFFQFTKAFGDVGRNTAVAMAKEYDSALLSARRLALSTSAAGKLAATLLEWARPDTDSNAAPIDFLMPLTHEELGNMAGLSRETVTRLLGRFRKDGLIEQHGEQMTLLRPIQLEALYS